MTEVLRISSSFSESWTAWIMLLLLVLLLIDLKMEPGMFFNHCRELLSRKERENLFNESTGNTVGNFCLWCFKMGIFPLAVYLLVHPLYNLNFLHYLLLIALWLGIALLKYLLGRWVMFTFLRPEDFSTARRQYAKLTACLCVLLYPVVLLILFLPVESRIAILIMFSLLAILFLSLYLWKAMQLFFRKILAGLYILLYLCTLEILPFIGFVYAAMLIVD